MQLVATLTLVLCVPTVIGGVFGMNEGSTLSDSPYGFAIVTGITVILLVAILSWCSSVSNGSSAVSRVALRNRSKQPKSAWHSVDKNARYFNRFLPIAAVFRTVRFVDSGRTAHFLAYRPALSQKNFPLRTPTL